MKRNQKSINKDLQIYEEDSSSQSSSYEAPLRRENNAPEEGEILEDSQSSRQFQPAINGNQPDNSASLYESSDEDEGRMEEEKRKRQIMWNSRNEQQSKLNDLSHEDLFKRALLEIEKTNKRVIIMRKRNEKRMREIELLRMNQQAYLTASNTHFRGTTQQYPIITSDLTGKTFLQPNYSLKVPQLKLEAFINKNIKEESSANYLNEVVKFENYAYQDRKRRRNVHVNVL